MGFPTSRQPRSCIPKMGLGSFFAEISTQTIKSLLQNSFSKDFQWHVVAQSNTCRTVSTFWQRKIWPQRHRSPIQDARFTFHTERAVSALLDRCCRRPATLLSCKLLCWWYTLYSFIFTTRLRLHQVSPWNRLLHLSESDRRTSSNRLWLNADKTLFVWLGKRQQLAKVHCSHYWPWSCVTSICHFATDVTFWKLFLTAN